MNSKISTETIEKMKQDRRAGATYKQIEQRYNVSRWATITYLRGIELNKSFAETLWKKAEQVSKEYLEKKGFAHILDLNQISPQSFFDIYAEKGKDKWLIDVTINESKDLVAKTLRMVKGFRCAILYVNHELDNFKFVELKEVK